MIDPASLIVGALLFIVGAGTGERRRRAPKPPRRPELLCSCGHGYGTHEAGAHCHSQQKRDLYSAGAWIGHEYARCSCRFYDGPEPLPRTWSPDELAGGTP